MLIATCSQSTCQLSYVWVVGLHTYNVSSMKEGTLVSNAY